MPRKPKAKAAELVELYNSGWSLEDIGKKFDYSVHHVRFILRRQGIDLEVYIDKGKILALHKAGWSTAAIADEMNLNETQVREVIDALY